MKTQFNLAAFALLFTLNLQPSSLLAQGTAFTYQGRLDAGGALANGSFDLRFAIYDAASGGNLLAGPLTNAAVAVSNGLFTVALDFGAGVFTGPARWLEIGVRTNSGGAFTTLTPRQPLTATPYAIYASNAGAALTSTTVAPDGVPTASVQNNAITTAKIADGTIVAADVDAASFNTTFWRIGGNTGTTAGTHFLGTADPQPVELKVNGQRVVRWERATNAVIFGSVLPNVIGGYESNTVASGIGGVTIAGGGGPAWYGATPPHTVSAHFGTIGGGVGNVVYAPVAVIAGGERGFIGSNGFNAFLGGGAWNAIDRGDAVIAGGRANTNFGGLSSIGGGWVNLITTNVGFGFVGGGIGNVLDADRTTIAGGVANRILAGALYATIGGGRDNTSIGGGSTTIAGGAGNAQTNSTWGAIGGGVINVMLPGSTGATIGGGFSNTVAGAYAAIPGGDQNFASSYGFAAGRRAKALHQGSFVWADATEADFASTATNQFLLRASGGVGVNTNQTAGAALNVAGTVRATAFQGDGSALSNVGGLGNFVFAYSTGQQTVTTPTLFQDILFAVDAQLHGWTHTAGAANYQCAQTGIYLVQYTAQCVMSATMSLRALVNGAEVPGTQAYAQIGGGGSAIVVSKSFLAALNAGDMLKLQFTGNHSTDRLAGGGQGGTQPCIALTMTRIQ